MKKILAILMAAAMLLALCACGAESGAPAAVNVPEDPGVPAEEKGLIGFCSVSMSA